MTQEQYLARLEKMKAEVPEPWNVDKASDAAWELFCDLDYDYYHEERQGDAANS